MESAIYMIRDSISFIGVTFDFIIASWPSDFVRIFWALVFLEIPRYLLSDFYVLWLHAKGIFAEPTGSSPLARRPLISIVLPALNEEEIIGATVASMYEQEYDNIEIIIVDDGSTDDTPSICQKLQAEGKIRYFRFESRQGKSAALNFGARLARGEYIIFGDTDSTFDRGSIVNIMGYFADPRIGAVSGNLGVRNMYTNLLTRFQAIEYLVSFTVGRRFKAATGILSIAPGAFGAFRRDVVERVGGHEPGPGNDSDLTIRVRKIGYQIAFAPDATCLTDSPTKFRQWRKQRLRWDRNIIRNRVRKHKDVFDWRNMSFSILNLISFVDVLFFSIFLSIVWLIYIADMAFHYSEIAGMVFLANYLLHTLNKFIQVSIAMTILEPQRRDEYLALYWAIPLFGFYRIAIRLVRITATVQEMLFRMSYRDAFAPVHVQPQMEVY